MLLMNLERFRYQHSRVEYFYAKHLCVFCIKQRQAVSSFNKWKNRGKVLCRAPINSNECGHLARNNASI